MCVRDERDKKEIAFAFWLSFSKNQCVYGGSGSWWDSEYILKVEPIMFSDRWDIECEKVELRTFLD